MVKSNPAASSLAQVLAASRGVSGARRSDTMSCDDLAAEARRASDMTDEDAHAIAARLFVLMPVASNTIH